MTQVSEVTEQGHTSQEMPRQSRLKEGLTLAKTMLKNPGAFRQFRVMGPDEGHYVRPPREYEIPPFRDDMRYSTSNEPYLRPTRWCNPHEPEVIAMANELGAFELSDYEFADAAFWFIKTKMVAEMLPFDSAGATLKRGTGTCYHLISVFIALCRAAGIKARYKTYKMKVPPEYTDLELSEQEATIVPMFNRGVREGEGEAYIDGEWVVAHVAMRPELYAVGGLPITKLGEDSIGLTLELIPGTIQRFESLPLRFGIEMKAFMWLAPAMMERANVVIQNRLPQGRKIIEEAGGIEAYDQNARRRRELSSVEEEITRLTMEAKRQQVVEFVE
jgi:hypothetical protein